MTKGNALQVIDQIEAEIPRLRRYARALTRNPDSADDLVQDCLVRAISKIESWQEGTNLRAWLMTILRNKFLNDCRHKKREGTVISAQQTSDLGVVPAQQDVQIFLAEFEKAFQHLSTNHREALMLVAVEGYSYEEAAGIIDVSVGTIKSRVSRARTNLREILENPEGTEIRQPG